MPGSRALRIALTVAAGVTVAATAAGVTYAATSTTSKVVYACANRAGTLKLLSKGTCPRGYSKVAINKQGPRGLTGPRGYQGTRGPRGLQGIQGIQGNPGPGAVAVAAETTSAVQTNFADQAIPGVGLNLHAVCVAGNSGVGGLYLEDEDTSAAYDVRGSYQLTTQGSGRANLVNNNNGGGPNLASGLGLVNYTQPVSTVGTASEFVTTYNGGGAEFVFDVTVARGSHVVLVHGYLHQASDRCLVQGTATPTG